VAGVAVPPLTESQLPPVAVETAVLNVTEEIALGAVTWKVCVWGFEPFTVPENVKPPVDTVSVGAAVTVNVTGMVRVPLGFAAPEP
jgi:hypothetical protein